MGLRTFPLVAVGACAYGLIGLSFVSGDHPDAKARLMQGLLSGMGFLGGGAILKMEDQVKGTASAATIWIVGALGFAVAFDQWWVALALSVLNWMTLYFLTPVKDDEQRE